ncbi:MAG TPA: chemotaxis protein CheB [Candidatus Didemnitutus sp.]
MDFPVIALGGSAGGLESFIEFLDAAPADAGMAYVFILHLPPDRDSLLGEILARHTKMPVQQVSDGLELAPNQVYVTRPDRVLGVRDGRLWLGEAIDRGRRFCPIDAFFQTLAAEFGDSTIAVVMSGMGTNGTAGSRAICSAGGLCIAQKPATAKFPSMPTSLIESGLADLVLAPREMPKALADYLANPYLKEVAPAQVEVDQRALTEILHALRNRSRYDFFGYKRPTILRRIHRRLSLRHLKNMAEYAAFLRENPAEMEALADDLQIHVTGFFRDAEVWQTLREQVLDQLARERLDAPSIRAWVPACATGEEAYSLAILLVEATEGSERRFDLRVFATDTSESVLGVARAGFYGRETADAVGPARLARFFTEEGTGYRVKKELRELIVFAAQDILQDPPFSRVDICTCRNLLIYLEPQIQRRALALIHFALREGGALVLGTSETAPVEDGLFEAIDKRHRIFRRIGSTRYGSVDFSPRSFTFAPATSSFPAGALAARQPLSNVASHALLDRFAPPSVVIDRQQHVMYYHGFTERFLTLPAGEPTRELMALVREPFQASVRAAVEAALSRNEAVTVHAGPLQSPEALQRLEVTVAPLDRASPPSTFLLSFVSKPADPATPVTGSEIAGDRQVMRDELDRVRSELRVTLEELQAGNEEMKAANEESTSVNEELQSTNEELETSKEELQSLNEELSTVNGQLQAKMEELEATTNDLSSLLSSTNIAVVFLDTRFRIRRYTPAVKDLLELIPSDVGRPLVDLARKFDDPDLMADAAAVLEKLIPLEKESASESGRVYLRRILPYRTTDNHIDGVVITWVDITRRKRAEMQLYAEEQRHRLMLTGVKEYAIFMLDRDGRIVTWNPAAEHMLGYSEAEAAGQPLSILYPPEARASGTVEARLNEARVRGSVSEDGWRVTKSGQRFWASGMISALSDHEGQMIGFVKVLRDNTERKRAEESLLAAIRAAEEANAAKDRFLANVSHELRTPLSAIVLWSAMFREKRDLDPAEVREGMEIIRQSAEEQQALIEDLIDTARISSGKLRLEPVAAALAVIANACTEVARAEGLEKRIAVTAEIDPGLGVARVDPHRLHQIVGNLLRNAIKFTPDGGSVAMSWRRVGDDVHIQVRDSGKGMTREFLSRIFENYFQAEVSTRRVYGGLGLGLGISRELVRLHGGTIAAESSGLGKGSIFTVVLPLPVVSDAPAAAKGAGVEPHALAGTRILLVEDMPATRAGLAATLVSYGAEVTAACSVAEALQEIHRRRPDVLLSDLGMPRLDGYDLILNVREMEKSQKLGRLPAVALTAFAGSVESGRAMECGFDRCLTKPVQPRELIRALALALGRNA